MRAARGIVVLFCLAAAGAAGQEPAAETPRRPALPASLQPLYGLALSAPPEFAANALLLLAGAPEVTEPALKRDLLEQAFSLASRAQHPYERVVAERAAADTRASFLAAALRLRLDTISLQSRAVIGLAGIDPAAAAQSLQAIAHPGLGVLDCSEELIPDLSGYYAALGAVSRKSFEGDERTSFLVGAISRMTSHAEVSPMARVIQSAGLDASQRQVVLGAFASRITSLPDDPLTYGFYAQYIRVDLFSLADNAGEEFGAAVKDYVAKASGKTCPASPESGAAAEGRRDYWKTPAAQRILEGGLALRFRPNGGLISDAERATPEWARKMTDFLAEVEAWRGGDEPSPADYYHQRAIVYEALVELTPPGPVRNKLLDSFVSFIATSTLQQQAPVEWFWHAQSLLSRMEATGAGPAVLAAYRESRNPILLLEASLSRLKPDIYRRQGLLP